MILFWMIFLEKTWASKKQVFHSFKRHYKRFAIELHLFDFINLSAQILGAGFGAVSRSFAVEVSGVHSWHWLQGFHRLYDFRPTLCSLSCDCLLSVNSIHFEKYSYNLFLKWSGCVISKELCLAMSCHLSWCWSHTNIFRRKSQDEWSAVLWVCTAPETATSLYSNELLAHEASGSICSYAGHFLRAVGFSSVTHVCGLPSFSVRLKFPLYNNLYPPKYSHMLWAIIIQLYHHFFKVVVYA